MCNRFDHKLVGHRWYPYSPNAEEVKREMKVGLPQGWRQVENKYKTLIDVLGAALNTRLLQASHRTSAGRAAAPAAVAAITVGWLGHVHFATTSPQNASAGRCE